MFSYTEFTKRLWDIYGIKTDMFWQGQYALYVSGKTHDLHDNMITLMGGL